MAPFKSCFMHDPQNHNFYLASEKISSATLALLLKCSHSATLALLLGAALLSQLPSRGLYRMFIVPLALLIAHNGTAPN